MNCYFNKTIERALENVRQRAVEALEEEGFGVLTGIDVRETLKEKLDGDFRKHTILGACDPPSAPKALLAEAKSGLLLPGNVIVQEIADGEIGAAAVDPIAAKQAVHNPNLEALALQPNGKPGKVIEGI